ncbi:MAG: Lin1244/Lin1753 domain-containing protein [Sulfurimonadaceae bacterium]
MIKSRDLSWFSHDSNAKDQPKCMLIIDQMGLEAYGIFWILIETLREQNDYKYPLALIPGLARKYNTTVAKMETIIYNYDLFIIEADNFFWNQSLKRRMQFLENKKLQQIEAGKKGVLAKKMKLEQQLKKLSLQDSMNRPFNDPQAIKENKTKPNEKKEKLSFAQFKNLYIKNYKDKVFFVENTAFSTSTNFKIDFAGYIMNLHNNKLLNKEDAMQVWKALYVAYSSDLLNQYFVQK